MLDYVFFHKQSLDQFTAHLQQEGIPYESRDDEMGLLISIPDDLADAVIDQVDEVYAALLAETEDLLAAEGHAPECHTATLTARLSDGRTASVSVPPQLLNRILSVISYAELNELVDAIVAGIEHPDNRPLCQR
jgi:hypothetical protein